MTQECKVCKGNKGINFPSLGWVDCGACEGVGRVLTQSVKGRRATCHICGVPYTYKLVSHSKKRKYMAKVYEKIFSTFCPICLVDQYLELEQERKVKKNGRKSSTESSKERGRSEV